MGLGDLDLEGFVPVDHVDADRVEVCQEVKAAEDGVRVASCPRRRAHSVEDEGVRTLPLAGIEHELARVQLLVVGIPPVELREERLEPERVLVEDSDRPVHRRGSSVIGWLPASLHFV